MSLNYSSFAKAFQKVAIKNNMTAIARQLFGFALDAMPDENGKANDIDRRKAQLWFNGQAEIDSDFLKYSLNEGSFDRLVSQMETILRNHIKEDKTIDFLEELFNLVNADEKIESKDKETAQQYFDDELNEKFLAFVFQLALNATNKISPCPSHKKKTLDEITKDVVAKAKAVYRVKQIPIPDDIQEKETEYVNAMLEGFADDCQVNEISKEELNTNPSYEKYKEDFNEQRKSFYAAESLRMAERDTESLKDEHGFEKLENEVYLGIKDALISKHGTGYERMHEVLNTSVCLPLKSFLTRIQGLVGILERHGLCHMLVKDKGVRWKK